MDEQLENRNAMQQGQAPHALQSANLYMQLPGADLKTSIREFRLFR